MPGFTKRLKSGVSIASRWRLAVLGSLLMISGQAPLHAGKPREWTSADKMFKVKAEFVDQDETHVNLRRTDTQELIRVSRDKFSDTDQKFLRFFKSMESVRPLEIKRIEKRLAELKPQLTTAGRAVKDPLGRRATQMADQLDSRLKLLKANRPYIPRLSPLDFAVGQIGELDDDLIFSLGKRDGNKQFVGLAFYELRFVGPPLGMWSESVTHRPDSFSLEHAERLFGAMMPPAGFKQLKRGDREDQLLRTTGLEVVRADGGFNPNNVLAVFPLDEVKAWLKDERR